MSLAYKMNNGKLMNDAHREVLRQMVITETMLHALKVDCALDYSDLAPLDDGTVSADDVVRADEEFQRLVNEATAEGRARLAPLNLTK